MPKGRGCEPLRELQMVVGEIFDDAAGKQGTLDLPLTKNVLPDHGPIQVKGYKNIDI